MYSLFFRHLESQSLFLEKMCHTHQLALFCWFNKFNKKLNHWKALHRSMCLNFSILAPQKIPRKTPAAWLWHCSNFPIGWPKTKARRIGYQPQSFKGLRGVAGEAGQPIPFPMAFSSPLQAVHLRMKSQTLEPSMRSMWVCPICSESSSFWNFISSVGHSLHQPRWHWLSTPIAADLAAPLAIQASSETSVHRHELRLQF